MLKREKLPNAMRDWQSFFELSQKAVTLNPPSMSLYHTTLFPNIPTAQNPLPLPFTIQSLSGALLWRFTEEAPWVDHELAGI
jgi:hypothetical protein